MEKITNAAAKAHDYLGDKLLKFVGGLVMEVKGENADGTDAWVASLGRVAFWAVFGHMIYVWMTPGQDVVAGEQAAFYALLTYNGGKILKEGAVDTATAWKSGQ